MSRFPLFIVFFFFFFCLTQAAIDYDQEYNDVEFVPEHSNEWVVRIDEGRLNEEEFWLDETMNIFRWWCCRSRSKWTWFTESTKGNHRCNDALDRHRSSRSLIIIIYLSILTFLDDRNEQPVILRIFWPNMKKSPGLNNNNPDIAPNEISLINVPKKNVPIVQSRFPIQNGPKNGTW